MSSPHQTIVGREKRPLGGCHEDEHDHGHPHPHHVLEVEDLCLSYGEVPALRDITFRTECGHSVGLIGPNGAGKSTLLKALAGLLRRECGEIRWQGKAMVTSHEIAYLPQREEVDWNFPATVRGIVEMGRYPHVGWWRRFSREDAAQVDRALRAMDLWDLQDRQISALSDGQQQRTFLARALAQEAHVFLLDEPFTGLDADARRRLSELIATLKAEGRLIIASHHDLDTVRGIYDEVLVMATRQIAFGSVQEVFNRRSLQEAYGSDLAGEASILAES